MTADPPPLLPHVLLEGRTYKEYQLHACTKEGRYEQLNSKTAPMMPWWCMYIQGTHIMGFCSTEGDTFSLDVDVDLGIQWLLLCDLVMLYG